MAEGRIPWDIISSNQRVKTGMEWVVMQFSFSEQPEAIALKEELTLRTRETDVPGLHMANLWLWDIEHGAPIHNPREVLDFLFRATSFPCRDFLVGPWVTHSATSALTAALQLLSSGVSLEGGAYEDEPNEAGEFLHRIFNWLGSPVTAFANMEHRNAYSAAGFSVFEVPHWVDEGLVLIGPNRVAALWFLGTD